MLVISRFHYDDDLAGRARAELGTCLDGLAAKPGFVGGSVGRAVDDTSLWVLTTRWADVGSYRRALSSYDVKVTVVPLLSYALDEPSAFEILAGDGAEPEDQGNQSIPRVT